MQLLPRLHKEKENQEKLKGNEVLQSSIMDIYAVDIDARGDYTFREGEEDDTFKDYLNQFTLPDCSGTKELLQGCHH